MTAQQDRSDNKWQWFFTFVLTAIIGMNGYIINKVDTMDIRQNNYIERIRAIEIDQAHVQEKCKETNERLNKIEAYIREEEYSLKPRKK